MPEQVKVTLGGRQVELEELRNAMDPEIRGELEKAHPDHAGRGAQSFVDAYAQAHQRQHGQAFTGERAPGGQGQGQGQGDHPHGGPPGQTGEHPQGGAPGQQPRPEPRR